MKREMSEIDELFKRDLPSASHEVIEEDGARVLSRLRTHRDESPKLNVELEFGRATYGRSVRAVKSWKIGLVGVAAAIVVAVFLRIPGAPAVLEDVTGSRKIEFGEVVRSGVLVLADSSRVEIRANSELLLERAQDGVQIHLRKGGVLVTAAKQRNGHLYVQTKDAIVSVIGTVFLVNVEEEGSLVVVIEGEVRVKHGAIQSILRKGEQMATNPNMQMMKLTSLPQSTTPETRTAPTPLSIVGDYTAELAPPRGRSGASEPPAPPPSPVRPGEVPKWEAVSIRPCAPPTGGGGRGRGEGGGGGGGSPYRFSSDRMNLNCLTVRSLIRAAYHVYLDLSQPGAPAMDGVLISGILAGRDRRDPTDGTDGGPDWLDTEHYSIEAKAEVVTNRILMQGPMLQAILEDRFKIKVHKETREIAVDALVPAKGGPKLMPFVEGSCVRLPPGYDLSQRSRGPQALKLHIKADANGKLSGTMEGQGGLRPLTDVRVEGQSLIFGLPEGGGDLKGSIENNGARLSVVVPPRQGGPGQPPIVFTRETAQTQSQPASLRYCRIEGGGLSGNTVNFVYNAEGVTIDEFARRFLSGSRGRFVINKTGLTGKFDIHLETEISPETRQRFAAEASLLLDPSTAPPLPEALEKQLGLKLESTKGLVEFLVVDHIDRPSEN